MMFVTPYPHPHIVLNLQTRMIYLENLFKETTTVKFIPKKKYKRSNK
ncbi:unnamed protein product [Brassica rapa subsp. narinosa]